MILAFNLKVRRSSNPQQGGLSQLNKPRIYLLKRDSLIVKIFQKINKEGEHGWETRPFKRLWK